ncbi:HAD family phosphatase [Micromonospora soli]|uniref:HAD family hydrolase n=1 Tax=Micromonospora sp. NBRC 110009 TaxID=3061627 RepID=UPI002671BDF3|nr:HAD family phosphatase [Micromonospora sp. NBRC 110009]WKT97717.1 HAD family phosphatase [Micromonospora sp. NBRC 110009]
MTPTASQLEAVVFDYGGVLTGPVRASIAAWLRADRIEPASFSRTLKAWLSRDAPDGTPIHRLETGALSVEEFDALLAAELTTLDGRAVDPVGVLGRLFAGLRPDPAMFALAGQLRDLGVRVGLLSNSWGNSYPPEIRALFDPVVISGEVGLRKPLAASYAFTLDQLGLPADRVLFVDDAEPNVLGARAAGMHALWHTDAESTRAALAEFLPALAPPDPPSHPVAVEELTS